MHFGVRSPWFGLVLIGHGLAGASASLNALFLSAMTAEQLLCAARVWRAFGSYAIWSGVVGILMGWVIMLRNLGPLSEMRASGAIGIMTLLYGSIALVFADSRLILSKLRIFLIKSSA